jgi:hypothetical protein
LVVLVVASLISFNRRGAPEAGGALSKDTLAVVSQYVQAQQDSVGADQNSPDAWFDKVRPITTPAWFAKLHPQTTSPTGSTPYNYFYAHQKNYVIKTKISNCVWDSINKPTDSGGLVDCSLNDETIDRNSGKPIPATDLPFSWTAVGNQASPRLLLVNQSGAWLVNGDLTGQAQ